MRVAGGLVICTCGFACVAMDEFRGSFGTKSFGVSPGIQAELSLAVQSSFYHSEQFGRHHVLVQNQYTRTIRKIDDSMQVKFAHI